MGSLTSNPCPQLPTITQAVLQYAALTNSPPEAVRGAQFAAVSVSDYVDAGNPSRPPAGNPTAITGFPVAPPSVLPTLKPLAFASASSASGTASPTQLYTGSANTFVYAVGGAIAGGSQPDTLYLFYEDTSWTNPALHAAKVSLPLTVLDNDGVTERAVSAVLQYQPPATGAPPCSASTIVGDFKGSGKVQSLNPAQIGVNCAAFSTVSALSPATNHLIVEVAVPFLITANTDPVHIFGTLSALSYPGVAGGAFSAGAPGFAPSSSSILGSKSQSIGIAPSAAPLGSTATYPLCANMPNSGGTLVPSAAADYAVSVDGEVLLGAPLLPTIPIVCPAM